MFPYRTFIGLDVHARSVVAHAINIDAEQPVRKKFPYDPFQVIEWARTLPGPTTVVYEAGPTGYDLARHFSDAGIECVVTAPSKLQRPTGDRVKTDARDAAHLAKLLQLGQIVPVAIPTITAETARISCAPGKTADTISWRPGIASQSSSSGTGTCTTAPPGHRNTSPGAGHTGPGPPPTQRHSMPPTRPSSRP